MTKDQVRAYAERQAEELFDSYVLVGRVAGTKQCVILCEIPDDAARNQIVLSIANLVGSVAFKGSE